MLSESDKNKKPKYVSTYKLFSSVDLCFILCHSLIRNNFIKEPDTQSKKLQMKYQIFQDKLMNSVLLHSRILNTVKNYIGNYQISSTG